MTKTTDPDSLERLYAMPPLPAEPWGIRWRQQWAVLWAWLTQPAVEILIERQQSPDEEIARRLRVQRSAYRSARRLRRNAPENNREILAHMTRLLNLETQPGARKRARRPAEERKP